MRYTAPQLVTSGAGAFQYLAYTANGLYDPEVAVGGHQPISFDQYMLMYQRATVVSSRITADIYQTTGVPAIVGIVLGMGSTPGYTSASLAAESGLAKWVVLPPNQDTKLARVTHVFNAQQWFGADVRDDDQYATSAGASPSTLAYFHLFFQDLNATSVVTLQIMITIDFDVILTRPAVLGYS